MVSPLIRIYNETEFSMELRFRRPQQDEGVFASVLLNKGDSIDDCMATFDAISLSGGLKKALMSLSVGMHSQFWCLVKSNPNNYLAIFQVS